jgi:ribosome biogenesis protein UTP30
VTQCDVCFIITDLDKTKKKDHDAAIDNFKEKLNKAGINFVKTIIPFTKLKKEYSTFELQKKFANSYDLFLLDGRISGHITGGVLRKAFHRRNKLITVTLSDAKLKQSIEAALFKTRYHQPLIPQLISIEVGTIKMSAQNVAENISTVLEQLKEEYPGGWMNIKSIHMKAAAQSSVVHPLYISTSKCFNKKKIIFRIYF